MKDLTIRKELDKLLTKFYEDSVDAYDAFMGTYTDGVADEEAPDRLIDKATDLIISTLIKEIRGKMPEKKPISQNLVGSSQVEEWNNNSISFNDCLDQVLSILNEMEKEL